MKNLHPKHIWYALAAYGVWFAIFSGFEEIFRGKYWKVILSLLFGILVYWYIETRLEK